MVSVPLVFVFFGLFRFGLRRKLLKNVSVLVNVENFLKNDVNLSVLKSFLHRPKRSHFLKVFFEDQNGHFEDQNGKDQNRRRPKAY